MKYAARLFLAWCACAALSCSRDGAGSTSCTPEPDSDLCAAAQSQCGPTLVSDRCGATRTLDCGSCAGDALCSRDHTCLCAESDSAACLRLHLECGTREATDLCGDTRALDCGACNGGGVCGAGGVPNVCASCQGESDEALCANVKVACGATTVVDRCGKERVIACGGCPAGLVCGATTPHVCGPQICEDDGFCWVNPLPQGKDLNAVWVASPSDFWAVGTGGTILHGNTAAWLKVPSPTTEDLLGIWGTGTDDLWVVGTGGAILHWNGERWRSVPSPTTQDFAAISGVAADSIRACTRGEPGAVFRWDGSVWSREVALPHTSCSSLWARGRDDYFVNEGGVLHWNGSSLVDVLPWATANAVAVWGAAPNDVWAYGPSSTAYHWDGTSWTETTTPCRVWGVAAMWGREANDVWASCAFLGGWAHWDGSTWSAAPGPQFMVTAIHGLGSNVVAVGAGGRMGRFDGTSWTAIGDNVDPLLGDIEGIWGNGAGALWVGGNRTDNHEGRVLQWNGSVWRVVSGDGLGPVHDVWGSGANDVWAGPNRWTGTDWVVTDRTGTIAKIGGTSAVDVWGCSGNVLIHWDGRAWSRVEGRYDSSCQSLRAREPDDVSILFSSTLVQWDGQGLSYFPIGEVVRDLWGTARNDLWAVGARVGNRYRPRGMVLHFDGLRWLSWAELPQALTGLCGRRTDDVWAVGNGIAHWDGSAWAEHSPGLALQRCWVQPDGEVWAVGDAGTILRRAAR